MTVRVWVASWQEQCCGDGFEVGGPVTWYVAPAGEDDFTDMFGAEHPVRVDLVEDHHGVSGPDEPRQRLTGRVTSIEVVTTDRALGDHVTTGRVMRDVWLIVPGTGRRRPVTVADPWEPEGDDDEHTWSFDGWLVEVAHESLEPAPAD